MSAIPKAVRDAVRDRDGGCVICRNPEYDVHHRQRRREGGHGLSNVIALCREHHRVAHSQPLQARTYGLIVPTWGDPATVPVWWPETGAWRQPEDDGTYTDA